MIPFSPPRIDDETLAEVNEALRSGWITTGPRTKSLEQKVADYCGSPKALCVNSATAGMELCLRYFGIGPGDEVIVPAYTYCSTANVVLHTGATPVMVDVNPHDFCINTDKIKGAITEKTKAIIPVDFAGMPCDYDEINQLVEHSEIKKHFRPTSANQEKLGRILVMADAAHSFGGIYYGTMVGSLCDLTVFSFHAVKNLTTAEGGAVVFNLPSGFNTEEVYRQMNTMCLHGQSKDALAKTQKGAWEYDVVEPGYKWNMTDVHAAIGLVEIGRYESQLSRRKQIFEMYSEGLNDDWFELPEGESDIKISSYHLYPLRLKGVNEAQRNEIIQKIFDQDVSVNVHFKPLPMLTAYQSRGYKMEDYPVTYDLFKREISLPVYYNLSDDDVAKVIDAVKTACEQVLN